MPTVKLYPNADGTTTNSSAAGSSAPYYTQIDEGCDSPNDSDFLNLSDGTISFSFPDLPSNASYVTGITIKIRTADNSKGRKISAVQMVQSDNSTALTASGSISGSTTTTTFAVSPGVTGSTSVSVWNDARVLVTISGSGGFAALYALHIEVSYEILPASRVITTDLSAWWHLNESSGNRSDSSGNSNTLTNNASVGSESGTRIGTVSTFTSASNQSLTISSNESLDLSNTNFSFCLWMSLTSTTNNAANDYIGVFSKGGGGSNYTFSLNYRPSLPALQVQLYNGGTTYSLNHTNVGAVSLGRWYHVVFTFNRVTKACCLWIDNNKQTGTSSVFATDSSFGVGIGRGYNNNTYNSSCKIGHVGLWRRLLTDEEVAILYNAGQTRDYPFYIVDSGSTGLWG